MKILLLGSLGQVGTHLAGILSRGHELVALSRAELDIANEIPVRDCVTNSSADLVINAAAYTAVDRAEKEVSQAERVNALAPAIIAGLCEDSGTPFIHFSTDYVFDGESDRPYVESDEPNPLGVYGATKLAGERGVLAQGKTSLVLRTSWVYSRHGNNFYKTMLRLAAERDELNVVADQYGAPTYAGSIADATARLVDIIEAQGGIKSGQEGIYHFSCGGQTSWHEFAQRILALNGHNDTRVHAITTADYPTAAVRPAYAVLDNTRLREVFGIRLPHWEQALERCVAEDDQG